MVAQHKIRATLLHVALWCVMIAIAYAPIATAVQMLNLQSSTVTAQSDVKSAAMPCHGAAHMSDGTALGDMGGCTCTPWCHAAVTTAVEFHLAEMSIDLPLPVARFVAAKTAQTPPLFKPPRA